LRAFLSARRGRLPTHRTLMQNGAQTERPGLAKSRCPAFIPSWPILKSNQTSACVLSAFPMPLHIAATYDRTAVAEFLLSNGADVNAKGKNDFTPLYLAKVNGQEKTAAFLRQIVEQFQPHAFSPNSTDSQGALRVGARVPSHIRSSITKAARDGERDRLKMLIEDCKGYDNGIDTLKEARAAAYSGRWHALAKDLDEALKAWKPPRVTDGGFARMDAIARQSVDGSTGVGDIHDAASEGDLETLKALLKTKPTLVSRKDKYGNTPLHWAAYFGHKAVVELLLSSGAKVNAKDKDGHTSLHYATARGHDEVAELLRQPRSGFWKRLFGGGSRLPKQLDNANAAWQPPHRAKPRETPPASGSPAKRLNLAINGTRAIWGSFSHDFEFLGISRPWVLDGNLIDIPFAPDRSAMTALIERYLPDVNAFVAITLKQRGMGDDFAEKDREQLAKDALVAVTEKLTLSYAVIYGKAFKDAADSLVAAHGRWSVKVWYRNKASAEKVVADDPSGFRPELRVLLAYMQKSGNLTEADHFDVMDAVEHGRYKIVPSTNNGDEGFDLIFFGTAAH
jgi:ankyrin repeat protein